MFYFASLLHTFSLGSFDDFVLEGITSHFHPESKRSSCLIAVSFILENSADFEVIVTQVFLSAMLSKANRDTLLLT